MDLKIFAVLCNKSTIGPWLPQERKAERKRLRERAEASRPVSDAKESALVGLLVIVWVKGVFLVIAE